VGQDLKPGPPEYEAGVLTALPRRNAFQELAKRSVSGTAWASVDLLLEKFNSHSASQEIPRLLWTRRVHNSSPLVPILSRKKGTLFRNILIRKVEFKKKDFGLTGL
jgi:hypothetical protein